MGKNTTTKQPDLSNEMLTDDERAIIKSYFDNKINNLPLSILGKFTPLENQWYIKEKLDRKNKATEIAKEKKRIKARESKNKFPVISIRLHGKVKEKRALKTNPGKEKIIYNSVSDESKTRISAILNLIAKDFDGCLFLCDLYELLLCRNVGLDIDTCVLLCDLNDILKESFQDQKLKNAISYLINSYKKKQQQQQ